jgi:uncharacterized heparinase superfamily protein
LKLIQFYSRGKITLLNLIGFKKKISQEVVPVRTIGYGWQTPIQSRISLVGPRRFNFLNQTLELPSENRWQDLSPEKLWLYNLHYFSDLNAQDSMQRLAWHKSLISDWISSNPEGVGVGWEPYPISLRVINWIKWAFTNRAFEDFELPDHFNQSLAIQVRSLRFNMEWHLLGNHLFSNAKALVFAGLYFESLEANSWLKFGLNVINKQLHEQVLEDGGHFERSPMYHALFLEDLLDLINLSKLFPELVDDKSVRYWVNLSGKMQFWLEKMSHPDGEISFFNDAAFGIAPTNSDLIAYSNRLQLDVQKLDHLPFCNKSSIKLLHMKDSGYIRMESRDMVALLDVASVGPDYLPGHAHADTLSFELSVFGQRVIVNGGTSCYGLGDQRLLERQTKSHSTVEVNGQSSSEVWSGFRVARRAYPFDLRVTEGSSVAQVSCAHDGYKRFHRELTHRRSWIFQEQLIEVGDSILGSNANAISRFILHPDIIIFKKFHNVWELSSPKGRLADFIVTRGVSNVEQAFYAAEFGKVIPTYCMSIRLENRRSNIKIQLC